MQPAATEAPPAEPSSIEQQLAPPTPLRPPDPMRDYERAERFKRVAGRRANLALGSIEKLVKTADRGHYAYTEAQVATILSTLRKSIDQLEAAYANSGPKRPRIEL
jgi:hypothetical protein